MAAEKRRGQVVINTLVTPTTDKKFPVVDSNDISGGRYLAETISERNKIPPALRRTGMICYVKENNSEYRLKLGFPEMTNLGDNDWEPYNTPIEEVEFPHHKVEEIEYEQATAEGFTKLIQKLDALDATLIRKLEQHQAVEDMAYANQIDGYTSLINHIKYLSNAIKELKNGSNLFIENINYQYTPNDTHNHASNLSDEIEQLYSQMNNPDDIVITSGGQRSSLKSKLSVIDQALAILNDPNHIEIASDTTLVDKLAAIDQSLTDLATAAQGAVQTIEQINYGTTPQGRNANLKDELDGLFSAVGDIEGVLNDPNHIVVGTEEGEVDGETTTVPLSLATKLTQIGTAIESIRNSLKIENISWNSTPEDHENTLTAELNKLYSDISTINAAIGSLQSSGSDSASEITAIQSTIANIQSSITTINTTLEDMNDPTQIIVDDDTNETLAKKLNDISNSLGAIANSIFIEDITYREQPVDHTPQTLLEELQELYSRINAINLVLNKTDSIIVDNNSETLTVRLNDIASSINSINTSITGLQSSGSDSASEITAIQSTIANIQSSITTINTTLEDMNDPSEIVVGTKTVEEQEVNETLAERLTSISNSLSTLQIAAQGAVQTIEQINYGTTPQGRNANLKDELDGLFSAISNLQTAINGLDANQIAVGEEGSEETLSARLTDINNDIISLTTTIADMNDPAHIIVDGTSETLAARLNSIATSITTLNGNITTINTTLEDMNDPSEIVVGTKTVEEQEVNETLAERLTSISNSLSTLQIAAQGAVQTIEQINYGTTPQGRNANLKDELDGLFSAINTINGIIADMNDPAKIIVNGEEETLTARLIDINDTLDTLVANLQTITTTANSAVQHIEDANYSTTPQGRKANLKDELDDLFSTLSTLQIAAQGAVQTIEQINYGTTPQGRNANLKDELDGLFSAVGDMNDPSKIIVGANDKTLTTKLSELDTAIADIDVPANVNDPAYIQVGQDKSLTTKLGEIDSSITTINTTIADMNDPAHIIVDGSSETLVTRLNSIATTPRFLLFSTVNLNIGVIKGQEYLVDKASNITEVVLYTDTGASIVDSISVKIQVSSAGGSYVDKGTFTLETNATNLISKTTLQTPIALAANDRVRIFIESASTSAELNHFSVRLTTVTNE